MLYNVLQYLEATTDRIPDKIAFTDGKKNSMTFKEVSTQAKAIGSFLSASIDVRMPVLVLMNKSPQNVTAFFGAVYAGCFYVPLDAKMPVKRMQAIIDTLHPSYLIYDEKNAKIVPELSFDCKSVLYSEAAAAPIEEDRLATIRKGANDTDILYVLFTSGSTGTPKGVSLPQRAIIDFTESCVDALTYDENTKFGNQVPLYFDMSVLEIYITLKLGCTMCFIPRNCFVFPRMMIDFLEEQQINTIFWVPYALIQLANAEVLDAERLKALKQVYFCGEVMPCKHLNLWMKALSDAQYANLYGPTETTVASTYYIVDRQFKDDDSLPIGIPFANTRAFLLKDDNTEATGDEIGELMIGGTGLAMGYYNNKEVTDKVFVQTPLHGRYLERVYHTGDLAKWDADGNLLFFGRKDYQIKHQGYRIELGEIETAISSIDVIENVCCIYDDEMDHIVCFYLGEIEDKDIILNIQKKVPSYMVPDKFIHMDTFPQNLSGKIDRKLLKTQYLENRGE